MRTEKLYIGTRKEMEEEFEWMDRLAEEKALKENSNYILGRQLKSLKEQLDIVESNPGKHGLLSWLQGTILFEDKNPEINFELKIKHIWIRDDMS